MSWSSDKILQTLDQCSEAFNFPMLDNGYVYLAATRMSLFWSIEDWALVIEVFGFSPRSEIPDIHIYSFASKLYQRNKQSNYVSAEAYEDYIRNNPNNEGRFIYPIDNDTWIYENDPEILCNKSVCFLRGKEIELPSKEKYREFGVTLEKDKPQVFEFCRYLAAIERSAVLASQKERRISVLPSMKQILQLEQWHHPDVAEEELPSECETFQQISAVLETGDVSKYRPTLPPNTHWGNWPDGGTL